MPAAWNPNDWVEPSTTWLSGRGPEPWRQQPTSGPTQFVAEIVVLEGLNNKAGFKHWSRRYKLVAVAKDEEFKAPPLNGKSHW